MKEQKVEPIQMSNISNDWMAMGRMLEKGRAGDKATMDEWLWLSVLDFMETFNCTEAEALDMIYENTPDMEDPRK